MSRLRDSAVRLANLFRRERLERELDAELQSYVELDVEENIRRGIAPKEARRMALARLGGVETVKEECRDVQRFRVAEDLWRDLRHGFRRLLARPVLAVVAVAVLAIGIGANVAILALVDALLLRPLPGAEPDRLVAMFTSDYSSGRPGANSYPDFLDIRDATRDVFESVTATSRSSVGVRIGGETRVMSAQIVEPNYFDTMGSRPAHGRGFETVETSAVAVISNAVWLSEFGGDPSVLGRAIVINGLPFTIVGVAPVELATTQGILRVDVRLPAAFEQLVRLGEDRQERRGMRGYSIVGRLRAGVGIGDARAVLEVVARRLHQSYPAEWTGLSGQPRALTIREAMPLFASGARGWRSGRTHRVGRNSPAHRLCQHLRPPACRRVGSPSRDVDSPGPGCEPVAADPTGCRREPGSGSCRGVPGELPRRRLPCDSWRCCCQTFPCPCSSIWSSAGDCSSPRWWCRRASASRWGFFRHCMQPNPGFVSGRFLHTRFRNALTAMQAAAAVFLLIIAGMFARGIVSAYALPLGFDPDELVLVAVDLETAGYSEDRGRAYLRQALEQLPTAEVSTAPFLSLRTRRAGFAVDGYQPRAGEDMEVNANTVSPGYISLMGVPFVRGRDIEPGERNAVLVNRAFARRFWSGQNPIGRRLGRPVFPPRPGSDAADLQWTVVGVVEDGHFVSFRDAAIPVVFRSMEDVYSPQVTFHMRGVSAEAARRAIGRIDPGVPVVSVATMSETVDTALFPARIAAFVSGLVGAVGLALACIGLFGTLSYVVAQRAPEIGLRVALGARALQIVRLVAGGTSVKLVGAGVVLGAGLGSGLAPLLQAQFAGAGGVDLVTLAGAAACLALVASVAIGVPAARALRIDPAEVLRVVE